MEQLISSPKDNSIITLLAEVYGKGSVNAAGINFNDYKVNTSLHLWGGPWNGAGNAPLSASTTGTLVVTFISTAIVNQTYSDTSGKQYYRIMYGNDTWSGWYRIGKDDFDVNVKDFGVKGDGTTNDSSTIQTVINNNPNRLIFFPTGIYKFNTGITIDISKVSIKGHAIFDFSTLASGTAITITGSGTGNPYQNVVNELGNLVILGPGAGTSVKGIVFDTPTEGGSSHLLVKNLAIYSFGTGIEFRNNSYIQNFLVVNVYSCGVGVSLPTGVGNAGERISFTQSTIFNSTKGVVAANGTADLYFSQCSLDYNGVQVESNGTMMEFHGCHVEGGNYATPPIVATGFGANIKFFGCRFLNTTNAIKPSAYFSCSSNATIDLINSDIHNIEITGLYFAQGTSRHLVSIIRPRFYEVPNIPLFISEYHNLLTDGGFEGTAIQDRWQVTGTGTRISDTRLQSGDGAAEVEFLISTVNPRSGTKSLRWQKRYGGGSAAGFFLRINIISESVAVRLYYRSDIAGTGFINYIWGNESETKYEVFGTETLILTTGASSYIEKRFSNPVRRPTWATKLLITLNGDSLGVGFLYFDDWIISPF